MIIRAKAEASEMGDDGKDADVEYNPFKPIGAAVKDATERVSLSYFELP